MRQRFPNGQPIAYFDVRGEVSSVGSVNTLVRTSEGEVVIPNSALLESVVRAPRPPA
jgi:small-conductance mechanosensitive channel